MHTDARTLDDSSVVLKRRKSRKPIGWGAWLILFGLLFLSVAPALGGSVRVAELSSGAEITAENARFFNSPTPVLIHIFSSLIYTILGAFQFTPHLRRWNPIWHRKIGRFLVPLAFASALSGLWMTLFYDVPAYDKVWVFWMRIVVSLTMVVSLVMAVITVRRRNYNAHGAWMIRAYALGIGAGTQAFTHIPWFIFASVDTQPDMISRALMMGAGWLINYVVAEWYIQTQLRRKPKHA